MNMTIDALMGEINAKVSSPGVKGHIDHEMHI